MASFHRAHQEKRRSESETIVPFRLFRIGGVVEWFVLGLVILCYGKSRKMSCNVRSRADTLSIDSFRLERQLLGGRRAAPAR